MLKSFSQDDCERLDRQDPLRDFRAEFELPQGVIYLDGNSLGALPKTVPARVEHCIRRQWGQGLIRSWNEAGWFDKPRQLGDQLAALLGAQPGEIVVTDSTSINLFKVLNAALGLRPERRVIVSETGNFPTDLYIAQGVAQWSDYRLRTGDADEIEALLADGGDIAALMLTHVNYKTGAVWDMQRITRLAHQLAVPVVWDLAHSAGALPVDLNACGVDFAVGCTYKYLNAGPGAPAFLFVAARHQGNVQQPLSGWWGHADPFAFDWEFEADPGIARFLTGTQPMLAFAALEASLEMWQRVDMQALRRKSREMTDLFIELVEQECAGYGLHLASPRDSRRRGSQVSWTHAQGYAVMQALIARGVIGDFRAPDIMRFGFAPLYLRYVEVWHAVRHLQQVLHTQEWRRPEFHRRSPVT